MEARLKRRRRGCGADVGGDIVRLGAAVCRRVDGAVQSARRPHHVTVVRQAATVATRQQPQQLRANGIRRRLYTIRGSVGTRAIRVYGPCRRAVFTGSADRRP